MDISSIRNQIAAWAAKQPEIEAVWLFGSRVKGCHHDQSDLDVAIEPRAYDGADADFIERLSAWRAELTTMTGFRAHISDARGARTETYLRDCSDLVYRRGQRPPPPAPDQQPG